MTKPKQGKLIDVKEVELVDEEGESKQVVVPPQSPQPQIIANPIDMFISKAIDKNVSLETMERLLAMRDKLRAEKAKEAFDNAMAAFQGECPTIKKTKAGGKTNSGIVAYYYAPLDSIVEQTKALISKNGLSYQIKSTTGIGEVTAVCIVKHRMGHSEESSCKIPLGTKTDIMSASQHYAAAMTFAKRYAFCDAFGIMTGDTDTDAAKDGKTGKPAAQSPQDKIAGTIADTIATIKVARDKKTLETWKGQISGSNLYNENQKKLLLGHIADQIKKC